MDCQGTLKNPPEMKTRDLSTSDHACLIATWQARTSTTDARTFAHGARVERCRCRCAHAKLQTRVVMFTIFMSLTAVCLGLYAVFVNIVSGAQQCGLSDEDKILLEELRRTRSGMLQSNRKYEFNDEVKYMDASEYSNPMVRSKRAANSGKGKNKKSKKKKKVTYATHMVPKFWDVIDKGDFKSDMCMYVKKWDGPACRNKTFRMKKGPMVFFQESNWMKNHSDIVSPISPMDDGRFKVSRNGLFYIYSSVLFHDSKKKHGQAIMKNSQECLFKCMDGVDYLAEGQSNTKYKTCSINGMAYLQEGDIVWLKNLYENTEVELSDDATFFGLYEIPAQPPPKRKRQKKQKKNKKKRH